MPIRHLLLEHLRDPMHIPSNIAWRLSKYQSSARHIFILGPSRCGTTLLKSIIAAHSRITGLKYETTGLLEYHNLFDLPIQEISQDDYMSLVESSGSLAQLYDKVANTFVASSGAERFVDKVLPVDPVALYRLRKSFPNAKFVFIIRDARDSYASAKRIANFYYTDTARKYAKYWRRKARGWLRCEGRRRFYLVKYEQLVDDPEAIMRGVMRFLGESFEAQQLEKFGKTTDLSIYDAKHRNLNTPINARSVGRWEKELTSEEKDAIVRVAGSDLAHFGYHSVA